MTIEKNYIKCQQTCPLTTSCARVPCNVNRSPFSEIGGPVDILFVSDHPGARETLIGVPFLGPEKRIIENVIKKTKPDFTYGFTYLVRGWPVEAKYEKAPVAIAGGLSEYERSRVKTRSFAKHPEKATITNLCSGFLVKDIQTYRPKIIVVMGNTVKEALFPREHLTITRLVNVKRSYGTTETRFMTTPKSLSQNPSGKRSWEKQLEAILRGTINEPDVAVGEDFLITDLEDALAYIEILKNTPQPISVDLETLNLNKKYGNKIATIQFAETNDTGVTIPYNHPESPFDADEIEILRKALYDLFHTPSKITFWIGQNLKFECNVLRSVIGTQILSAPMFDTQVAAFLLDENRRERAAEFRYGIYSLKQLAYDYLNFDGYDRGILANRAEGNLFDLPLDKLSSYGAMDVYITRRLWLALLQEAEDQNYREDLENMMFNHYTPCIRLCSDLENNGFHVGKEDLRTLFSLDSPLLTEVKQIEEDLKESIIGQKANLAILRKKSQGVIPLGRTPWVFDLAKGGHAQTLFFDVLCLEPGKVGKSGVPSVDAAWQKNNADNEYVAKFSEWQGLRILYNTFVKSLYARIDPRGDDLDCNTDGRIRPDFLATGPVTGRWACRKPNLQNIPRSDTPAKKAVKNIFQAMPGHFLVQLDYAANEVRWAGIMAGDENLAKAVWEGKRMFDEYRLNPSEELLFKAKTYGDLHKQTASMVFNKDIKDITKGERQATKSVVFGLLYGSSTKSIAESTQKTVEEVQDIFDQFYARFPKIEIWKNSMENHAQTQGYVKTPNGRRRRFPIFEMYLNDRGVYDPNDERISNEDQAKIAECLRQSVNAPIQGIASDSGMLGATLFADYIRDNKKSWLICNAVHDSCVYQVPYKEIEESLKQAEYFFTEGVMAYMTRNFGVVFNLPLEIDFEIGLRWGDLEEWDYSPKGLVTLKEKFLRS